jgi:hypothetical protein
VPCSRRDALGVVSTARTFENRASPRASVQAPICSLSVRPFETCACIEVHICRPGRRGLAGETAAGLAGRQAAIVDGLKAHCPGYAVMRSLMLAFRSILRQPARRSSRAGPVRTAAALRRWLDRAEASGIAVIRSFVEQLRRDVRAVEAAGTERWSNGPVEGHVNRLKT